MRETQMVIPDLFKCPISLDLFKDPVTLSTGQTYDRSSIEKWLGAGNLTCPVSMQKLHDRTIVPNHTLRHLIHHWLLHMGPTTTSFHDPLYFQNIQSLKQELESSSNHEISGGDFLASKLPALNKLKSRLEESRRLEISCFLQLGFFPLLLNLTFGQKDSKFSEGYSKFSEISLSCIVSLMRLGGSDSETHFEILNDVSKIESFEVLFEKGTREIKKNLCEILVGISSSPDTKSLCAKLGKNQRILRESIALIRSDSDSSEYGIRAISAISSLDSNRESLIEAGAVNELVKFISESDKHKKSSVPMAVETIDRLLVQERGKMELMGNPDGIKSLVKMVFRVSENEEGSESAIDALMKLCCCESSSSAREGAVMAGVVTQLLLLLQSQCSGRTKSKARMLMKMLRSK